MAKESAVRFLYRQTLAVVAGYVSLIATIAVGTALVTGDWHLDRHLIQVVRSQVQAVVGQEEPKEASLQSRARSEAAGRAK